MDRIELVLAQRVERDRPHDVERLACAAVDHWIAVAHSHLDRDQGLLDRGEELAVVNQEGDRGHHQPVMLRVASLVDLGTQHVAQLVLATTQDLGLLVVGRDEHLSELTRLWGDHLRQPEVDRLAATVGAFGKMRARGHAALRMPSWPIAFSRSSVSSVRAMPIACASRTWSRVMPIGGFRRPSTMS